MSSMTVNPDRWCILPTPMGNFRMYDTGDDELRVVCVGDLREQGSNPLLRLHSSCLASEVFGAQDCDCADQLRESMKRIANAGRGVIVHLHQEGRGQGLSQKIAAVNAMQQQGLDTVEAFEALELEQDTRSYAKAVDLLTSLKINSVRLISNNPAKARYLTEHGLQVEMVRTHPTIRPENVDYLKTKKAKLDHRLPLVRFPRFGGQFMVRVPSTEARNRDGTIPVSERVSRADPVTVPLRPFRSGAGRRV